MYFPGIERELAKTARKLNQVRTQINNRPAVFEAVSRDRITDFPETGDTEGDSMEQIRTKAKVCTETISSRNYAVCLTGKALGSYFDSPAPGCSPYGTAHQVLALLVQTGLLTHIVSTDTRGLFIRAGVPPDQISEIHGNVLKEICPHCGTAYYRAAIAEGPDEKCIQCDKKLLNSCTGYGMGLVTTELKNARQKLKNADVIIVAGSLLDDTIARSIPFSENNFTVLISTRKTKFDHMFDVRVCTTSATFFSAMADETQLEIPASSPQFNELIIPRQTLPWKNDELIKTTTLPLPAAKDSPRSAFNPEWNFASSVHNGGFWTSINSNYEHCRSLLNASETHISDICIEAPGQWENCSKTLQRLKEIETCLEAMYNATFKMLSERSRMQMPDLDNDLEMAKQLSLFSMKEAEKKASDELLRNDSEPNLVLVPRSGMKTDRPMEDAITQLGKPPLISKASLNVESEEEETLSPVVLDDEVTEGEDIILGAVPPEREGFLVKSTTAATRITGSNEDIKEVDSPHELAI